MWSFMAVAVLMAAGVWASRRRRARPAPKVEIDAEGVRRTIHGQLESVRWADLREVALVTTSDGPMGDDLFYLLLGPGKTGCAVPSLMAGALLARLQRLPRFNNEAVIKAVGSITEAYFPAWSGAHGEGTVCATDVDTPPPHA